MIEFEYALAKLAVEVGSGEIRTVSGNKVEITDWNSDSAIYPILGDMYEPIKEVWISCSWTKEGKYYQDKGMDFLDLAIEELC